MFRPVAAGLWQHKDLLDGTYSFEDLLDIHELLDVRQINEARTVRHEIAMRERNLHGS